MKLFAFFIALICLLESVTIPASVFAVEKEQCTSSHSAKHCCTKSADSESSNGKSCSQDCDTLCSPFQNCGCYKASFPVGITLVFGQPVFYEKAQRQEPFLLYTSLQEGSFSINVPPPEFS